MRSKNLATTRAGKTLSEMPDAVRASAWVNSRHRSNVAASFFWLEEKMHLAVGLLARCAWWVVLYWIAFARLPIDTVAAGIPAVRNFIVVTFALSFCLTVLTHWMGIQMSVSRADKTFPVLADSAATAEFKWLALPLLAFSTLLFLSCFNRSHGAITGTEHLPAGIGTLAMGLASLWLYWKPLTYGYQVPTDRELERDSARRRAVAQTSMLARGPGDVHSRQEPEPYATPITPANARTNFAAIHGMAAVKQKLIAPARAIIAERPSNISEPANGILLHGEPGNGKTAFAEALAGELGVPFLQLTYGDVASKWVGEMPRMLVNCFALAQRTAPCVFLIDELDSFLVSRDAASNNAEDAKITNTLLTEVTRLRQHRVVLVGATNHLAKLDAAAVRDGRFDFKVEVSDPDEVARLGLLRQGVAQYASELRVLDDDLRSVAKRWAGFSVARLQAVARALPRYAAQSRTTTIDFDAWMGALRDVQGRAGRVPPQAKPLGDLMLTQATRDAIELVASRLKNVARIEGLGGTLPTGVVFHGPSGTGKTAAAMALARECGWAFFATSGPELATDREKLLRLYRDAKDARPALVFIDEADSLLRAREFSMTADLTNSLLVLMDGAAEKISDVVFIAATNHPEAIDPAMLRAGRFTEKVAFSAPGDESVHRYVAQWLAQRQIPIDDLHPGHVALMLEGQTIADIEGILQYALNRAISRHSGPDAVGLTAEDLRTAIRIVAA